MSSYVIVFDAKMISSVRSLSSWLNFLAVRSRFVLTARNLVANFLLISSRVFSASLRMMHLLSLVDGVPVRVPFDDHQESIFDFPRSEPIVEPFSFDRPKEQIHRIERQIDHRIQVHCGFELEKPLDSVNGPRRNNDIGRRLFNLGSPFN